ncbi:hypothetical protein SASPL_111955 [Salvia splendens]|uniref:Uncharacterized protein n=1 Tax=Salvia splendens TaxID=180675 RepID=A0A8X9A5M3_SALSN|nr:hypothetical protein SASPL_111955 [Salvia splendens]
MSKKVGEMKRFGDKQSSLLDEYERLSFEVQLNNAMLGRCLSEPAVVQPPKQRRMAGFQKVMKKLFSPILGKKGSPKDTQKIPFVSHNFSRSLRV